MSTIYFIRHGQASFGKADYDVLSEKGKEQSRLLAGYYIEKGIHFDVMYRGTLKRHIATAEEYLVYCKNNDITEPGIEVNEKLNEYDSKKILTELIPVLLEVNPAMEKDTGQLLQDRKSFQRVFEAVMHLWSTGNYDRPGMQTWKCFTEGVNSAIDDILGRYGREKNIGIFTSGGPISVALKRTLKLDDESTMAVREQIVNTSVSRFKCTDERIMVATFNEYAHLEDKDLITYR